MMNISRKFENPTYNTLVSRGVTGKSLHTVAAVLGYSCLIHSIHWMPSVVYNNTILSEAGDTGLLVTYI